MVRAAHAGAQQWWVYTLGVDISMHVALTGVERVGPGGTRGLIEWASAVGVRGVRLDATRPDVRPRMLDRSARRDLAASIRRAGLVFGGLDLLIPAEHFIDPADAERATEAVVRALGLAADLAELAGDADARTVAVTLPEELPDRVLSDLDIAAAGVGATLADCTHPPREDSAREHVLAGIDPPGVILSGDSPAKLAARLGSGLAHARLSDISGAGRCPVGTRGGRLDVTAYAAALAVSGVRAVTIDLRGLHDPDAGLRAALEAWSQALTLPEV